MRPLVLLTLLLAAPLTGCVAPAVQTEPAPSTSAPLALEAERCEDVAFHVAIDLDAAREALPEGFEPAPAASDGRGLATLLARECPAATLQGARFFYHTGHLRVRVEAPAGAHEADAHEAELALLHTDDALGSALAAFGWPAEEGHVTRTYTRVPELTARGFHQVFESARATYRADAALERATGTAAPLVVAVHTAAGVWLESGDAAYAPAGAGTFEASEGSLLARLAGATSGRLDAATYARVDAHRVDVRP